MVLPAVHECPSPFILEKGKERGGSRSLNGGTGESNQCPPTEPHLGLGLRWITVLPLTGENLQTRFSGLRPPAAVPRTRRISGAVRGLIGWSLTCLDTLLFSSNEERERELTHDAGSSGRIGELCVKSYLVYEDRFDLVKIRDGYVLYWYEKKKEKMK